MAYKFKTGTPFLYDEVTGDIVGWRDPDGDEHLFADSGASGGGGGSELATAVGASRALTADDDQKTLKATASGVTLTLPEGLLISTLVIPHSGGTSIDPTGSVTLNGAGTTLSATTGVICIIPEDVANAYRVTGAA